MLPEILNLRPMSPWEGPPLPMMLEVYWPWSAFECPVCHEKVYKKVSGCETHFYSHYLDGDITESEYRKYLDKCPEYCKWFGGYTY